MNLTIKSYMKLLDASPEKRAEYDKRYASIADQIDARWYSMSGHVILDVRIPSEKTSKVFYDVLLEFTVGVSTTMKDFVNANVSVFSNCPSFVFSNAKLCYEHGMGIGWAKSLLNQATLESKKEEPGTEAKEKEPQTTIKCEKSLYYAMKYLISMNAIQLFTLLNGAVKVNNPNSILMHIKNADKTMDKRQNATKSKAKPKVHTTTHVSVNESNKMKKLAKTKVVTAIAKTANSNKNKKVKKVKHI